MNTTEPQSKVIVLITEFLGKLKRLLADRELREIVEESHETEKVDEAIATDVKDMLRS